jgi:tetratricopeptide (TPR) repeat protein
MNCKILAGFVFITLTFLFLIGCGSKSSSEEAARNKENGIEKAKQREYSQAVILLEQAADDDVKDIQVYWYLAESYEGLGKYDLALETWQKLLFVADPKSQIANDAHERFLKARDRQKA